MNRIALVATCGAINQKNDAMPPTLGAMVDDARQVRAQLSKARSRTTPGGS